MFLFSVWAAGCGKPNGVRSLAFRNKCAEFRAFRASRVFGFLVTLGIERDMMLAIGPKERSKSLPSITVGVCVPG